MKFPYKLANGDTVIIDVTPEVAEFIKENDRLVSNAERRHRYNAPYHIDANKYEGMEYADMDSPEELFIRAEAESDFNDVMATLTATQYRHVLMRANGMTIQEIADEENICYSTARGSLELAKKKLEIAPGVIVGRLQNEGVVKHNMLNSLKEKYVITA